MRIRVWNAFASNNSGSYTIVGSFRDAALAEAAARELGDLAKVGFADPDALPAFAAKHGLGWDKAQDEEWPQYDEPNVPEVAAVGGQVVVHCGYAISLSRLFGAYFYKAGGRVDAEIEHAHHPIVSLCEMSWPWRDVPSEKRPSAARSLRQALTQDGFLTSLAEPAHAPVVFGEGRWLEAGVTVAIVFADLVDGFRQLTARCKEHGATAHLKVSEALSDTDPLAPYRGRA
jgi:hypothetical protein